MTQICFKNSLQTINAESLLDILPSDCDTDNEVEDWIDGKEKEDTSNSHNKRKRASSGKPIII